MTETAGRVYGGWLRPRLHGAAGAAERPPRPTFADLARAHKRWLDAPDDAEGERRYAETLAAFEHHQGRVETVYWCSGVASGAAVTVRRGRRRFHRVTAWAAKPDQRVAALLNECDELGVRISEVLRGTGQRIAAGLVLRTAGNLLALVDEISAHAEPQTEAAAKLEAANLSQAQAYYRRAARRQAQLVYVAGMLAGVLVLLGVVLAVLAILHVTADVRWLPHKEQAIGSLTPLYLCAISGALGADVSVASRIDENTFRIDYELGRFTLLTLGAIRPLLGAVFGIALYAALASGILAIFQVPKDDVTKELLFFLVVSFLAGFSERWAKGVLVGLEGGSGNGRQEPKRASDAAGRAA